MGQSKKMLDVICHTLPKKSEKAKSIIIVRFTSRKQRNSVLLQANNLRRTNVYINKHLTKKKIMGQKPERHGC